MKNRFCRQRKFQVSAPLILICISLLHLVACIVPFETQIDEDINILSIEGGLIKGNEEQKIIISRTTTLENTKYTAVANCEVSVIDNLGNEYVYFEKYKGTYSVNIPDDELIFNRQYQLRVITPEGKRYESVFESLEQGAEVDSVYYQMAERFDKFTGESQYGAQFYIDIKASDSLSRYYRWNLEETYEINSIAPISYFYTGIPETPIAYPNSSTEFYTCWKTENVRRLFLSNTINSTVNEKKRIPLNFVSTETDRLKIKYSLLVSQYALNEGAYNYWSKLRTETQDAGGLYTQQPGLALTNMRNIDDDNEIVLGYFWLAHNTKKRIFVPGINSIDITGGNCKLKEYEPDSPGIKTYPIYIHIDYTTELEMTSSNECFNCIERGGVSTPPDYWE